MKKILTSLLIGILLCSFAARAQQVGLTIAPQGTQPYTAGTNFQVYANYNYSNITGNVEVEVTFNSTILYFCGSTAFPYPAITSTVNPTTTRIKYTFPATSGNNQTGVIMMCFSYICPQTCAGQNINTAINGSISAPANSLSSTAAPANINGIVNNNWNTQHTFSSFIQSSAEVTFKVTVNGSTCHKIGSPSFVVNPNIGTLVSASNATVSGNTFTPTNVTEFIPYNTYIYYYTIKLPCTTPASTVVTSNVTLRGTNCGNSNATIKTLQPATYTTPATVFNNAQASLTVNGYNGYYHLRVINIGNTPLNLALTNALPAVNTTGVVLQNNTQGSGVSSAVTYYDCSNVASGPFALTQGTTNTSVPTYATKANINITNLLPGYEVTYIIYYNTSNSCSGVPTQNQFPLYSSLNFNCSTAGLSTVCYGCTGNGGTVNDTAVYVLQPTINCDFPPNTSTACYEPGDTATVCLRFRNNGSAPLLNGVLDYNLPAFLTFIPGSETFTGFSSNPVYQPGTSAKWDLPTLPVSSVYDICFKVKVNANAAYGSYPLSYKVGGTGYPLTGNGCPFYVNICALPQAEVHKKVKGNLDAVFSANGTGYPGTTAQYEVTVKNTGNTAIGSIELIDRLPAPGDASIMTCAPRNSQFQLFPSGPLSIPNATVTYSNTANIATGWPTTATACAVPGSFGTNFQPNSIKIALQNNIPPGGSFTFTFPVVIPAGATEGQTACNTIGMICKLIDNNNNSSAMNPVESNPACLKVVSPPPQCHPCREVLRNISATQGALEQQSDYYLQKAVLNFTTGKTLQEFRVSLANVDYTWNNKGCGDCKIPVMERGCLYPQSSTQTIGGLVWDNYSNLSLPPNADPNACMEELIWKPGTTATAGSYSVPLQVSLPKPVVDGCCELEIRSICFRVTFKDKDCNTCDTIICVKPPQQTDCCRGSHWTANKISWNPILTEGPVLSKITLPGTGPVHELGTIQAKCDTVYKLNRNIAYTFFAGYQCGGGSAANCDKQVVLNISGPGTNITQTLGNNGYSYTFQQTGTYTVTYTAYCGGQICNVCRYKVVIGKGGIIATEQSANSNLDFKL